MKLRTLTVTLFRNFIDSGEITIQDDVTCLVGKNEAGKSAVLHALARVNLAGGSSVDDYSVLYTYPAWLQKKHQREGKNLDDVDVVDVLFELEDEDMQAVAEKFGDGALSSKRFSLQRDYAHRVGYGFDSDEKAVVAATLNTAQTSVPQPVAKRLKNAETFSEVRAIIADLQNGDDVEQAAAAQVEEVVNELLGEEDFDDAIQSILKERLPRFFYFDRYSTLPYSINIRELLAADPATLSASNMTALSLLRQGGADNDYLLNADYEVRKRELENVANGITDEVLEYWTQNPDLRVVPDITQRTERRGDGVHSVLDELKLRIWDDRHNLTLRFDQHSAGFQWFFSFLAAFSQYDGSAGRVIILLDEPGVGLHARAQADFLRFIDERLSKRHQVIYTTHSAFMVQPGKLDRVRLVEDRGRTEGAKVSADILASDPDTLFPLQAALGYDLAQHLLGPGPHNLLTEGTSDFAYLTLISDFLRNAGRVALDERWRVLPVGGADLIPTFVALLGHHLDVTVLLDSRREGNQRLTDLADKGYLAHKRIVTVGEIVGRKTADIEDLFDVGDYLSLYNRAFKASVKATDLKGTDAIVRQIARHLGIERFDHGIPADAFLRAHTDILPTLSPATLDNFEKLFARINETLEPPAAAAAT